MNTKTLNRTMRERQQRKHKTLTMTDAISSNEFERTMQNPTTKTYKPLDYAHAFMNQTLFSKSLPKTLIALQRMPNAYGFYDHNRFARRVGNDTAAELALNPRHFRDRTDTQILGTLTHEMVDQLRAESGDKRRACAEFRGMQTDILHRLSPCLVMISSPWF
jgi:hypothetical protein